MLVKLLIFGLIGVAYARPNFECPSSGRFLVPHETDCDKFYFCNDGIRSNDVRSCGGSLRFSYEKQVCEFPENVKCVNSNTQVVFTNVVRTSNGELLENGCPADFEVHLLLPHETDCDKFYHCDFGERVLTLCAPGTHFSNLLQVCVLPAQSECVPGGGESTVAPTTAAPVSTTTVASTAAPTTTTTAASTAASTTTTTAASTTSSTTTTTTSGTLPNGCPEDFNVQWFLPHECQCQLFYECINGDKFRRTCEDGYHFNAVTQKCEDPATAGCEADPECDGSSSSTTSTEAPTTTTTAASTAAPTTTTTAASTAAPTTTTTATSTTSSGTLPNGCPEDFDVKWFLPHECQCQLYYECINGDKFRRSCEDGYHFNEVTQLCEDPVSAGCDPSPECTLSTTPSTEAPTSTTTVASTEAPTTTTTVASTEASTSTTTVASTEGSTSTTTVASTEGSTSTTTVASTEGPTSTTTVASTEGSTSTTTVSSTQAATSTTAAITEAPTTTPSTTTTEIIRLPNGCPEDIHIHWLLPHEYNCSLFYYCVRGELVLRECAPGTHFNPIIQVCDWPENVGCEPGTPVSTVSTTEGNSDGSTSTTPSTTTTEIVRLPNGCPEDMHIHWLLPHEYNCSLFYYCVRGELVLSECAPGTHFNPTLQVCDHIWAVGCVSGDPGASTESPTANSTTTTLSPTTTTTTAAPTTTSTTTTAAPTTTTSTTTTLAPTTTTTTTTAAPTTTPSTTTTPVPTLPNGCPEDFDKQWFLPHECDCGLYYECIRGDTAKRYCESGLHFSPTSQRCEDPATAGCDPNFVNSTQEISQCPDDHNKVWRLPHECDCELYYECVEGEKVRNSCEDGFQFNATTQACEDPETSDCESGSNCQEAEDKICKGNCNVPYWRHKDDCSKFWRCAHEKAVLGQCADGLSFNEETQTCDYAANVNCNKVVFTASQDDLGDFFTLIKYALSHLSEQRDNVL
ncbi:mucin-5AC-like isoform X2 [Leptidea sinapis]|uniref:mucin-5AC-like isoform X2 n=1 Tax=Leptidea sinapis TaxID=189913 RepID=UPI0021C2EBAC|nr:mucin-5AC-like isoform X2 [Leptidea sinapis]